MSVEEVADIKESFKVMDINNNGKITLEELKVGLHKTGHQLPDADIQMLMEAVSEISRYIVHCLATLGSCCIML